jgi:hypothetical protein
MAGDRVRHLRTAQAGQDLTSVNIQQGDSETGLPATSRTFKTAAAKCRNSTDKVLGTGAAVLTTSERVGLQLSRASKPRDISRATAREDTDAGGYNGTWRVRSYAVCAPVSLVPDVHVEAQLFPPNGNAPTAQHSVECKQGDVVGVGGGGGLTESGAFWLQSLYPDVGQRVTFVVTGQHPSTVGQAVCAG